MQPWQHSHLLLEEQLEILIKDNHTDEDLKKCILVLMQLCKDIDNIPTQIEKKQFWNNISYDIEEVLSLLKDKEEK